jgi:dTDP-4-dehydrorhamnose 3,5-epimerase
VKILDIKHLAISGVKVIKFQKFVDDRGFFTETFRETDIAPICNSLRFTQTNQSFSKVNVIRGLHFQWNPYMAKLVRTITGHLVDIVLDIRPDSNTFGKAIMYDMPSYFSQDFAELIYVPIGFAHGTLFTSDTIIEYFCSGEYSPRCECNISPLSADIDWSLCDPELLKGLKENNNLIVSDKDQSGISVSQWKNDKRAENFKI